MARVLIVDDDRDLRRLLCDDLQPAHETIEAGGAEQALSSLGRDDVDVVVTDVRMPGRSGLELCAEIVASYPSVPVIVMTAFGSIETAVQAIRAGAYDFITKPFEPETLEIALARALEHHRLTRELQRLRRVTGESPGFAGLLGTSPPMQRLYEVLERVASSEASVLVHGSSGTGKELVARALHGLGRRARGPFVAVNCAALPEALLEAELFGHEKGAFTDARAARLGLLREAHGGTLLLDEVGDMPPALQSKLLRALQERSVRPVGGSREIAFDTRVLAATHRDLRREVDEGRFRADLYFRLSVVPIEVPDLRERGADIVLLAEHFLDELSARDHKLIAELSQEVVDRLCAYSWPGNVRELKNCIEHAVAMCRGSKIDLDDLPLAIRNVSPPPSTTSPPEGLLPLFEVERRHILRVLDAVQGNKSLAARVLGVDRKTLHSKLQRYGRD